MHNTAVLIIDFINDIVHPDGKFSASAAFVNEHNVIKNANHVIDFARRQQFPIAFIKVGFHPNYIECPDSSPIFSKAKQLQALCLNTWGTEFHQMLDLQNDDLIIIKHRVSAFYATALEAFLRANKIQNLIISGVSTDMVVQTTARDAHDRDYKVTIVANACGASSKETHDNSLKLLERIATIIDTNNLKEITG